ncbi:MAG: L28 family ribosomal protein [Candidatus Andersenbacteria bacterium]
MAQRCDICGRGAGKGNRRSHSNIATIVRRKINLQHRTIGGKRHKVCVNCLKSAKIVALAGARA